MIAVQHLDAGHDVDGNPRRIWMIYRTKADQRPPWNQRPVEAIILDEGYSGQRILLADMTMDEYENHLVLEPLQISFKEYQRLRKRRLE